LSSAILYAAIVAIWACVLIPRWLRRDSSARVSDETATVEETPEVEERAVPEPRRRPREVDVARASRVPEARREARVPQAPRVSRAVREPRVSRVVREPRVSQAGWGREHARVLSSRRRLLGLIVLIVIGSAALAVTRMAAWWVLGPPSVMLLGYLVLLREASKADAERRELASARADGAADVATRVVPVAPAAPVAPVAPAVRAGRPVRVPDAEVIEISASRGPGDGGPYDQYADAKLRAVGD
jgi:hypothetical protein